MAEMNKDGFIKQAGILAAAGILCRIIGLLYRSPLAHIIGNEGNGYYSSAYNIYTVILLVASYSIPSAISKVIAGRLALKEYKNAQRIFHCALIYIIVVGGLAAMFAFLFAAPLVDYDQNSVKVLRVFAPTIFFSGLLGVLRGYFQAYKTMLQTSVSQILEQIFNAGISLGAAWLLIRTVADKDGTTQAVYGAAGSAMGTGIGVLIALIFMYGVYTMNRKGIRRKIALDRTKDVLSYRAIFRIILLMVTPIILSTFIYNFSTSLDQTIYYKIMRLVKDFERPEMVSLYGIYAGKSVVIANIPIAIASAMSAALIPTISGTYAKGDMEATHQKINEAIHVNMLISIPAAVGLFVLAKPIYLLLFPSQNTAEIEMAARLLMVLSITVVFFALSTLTNGVLQGVGKVNQPVINAAVALAIQTTVLILMLYFTDLGLYALALTSICYSFLMCILNGFSVKRSLGYKQQVIKAYALPFICASIMGVAAFLAYEGMHRLVDSNIICLVPALIVAVIVYFVTIVKTGALAEEEMRKLPLGARIIAISKKMKLIV